MTKSNKIPENFKELSRKELRKIAKEFNIDYDKEYGRKELRKIIRNRMNDITLTEPKKKEALIIDFIKSMTAIEEAIEPYKEQKKDLKKQYKENKWLDSKEQKRALQALRFLKSGESMDALVNYYVEIQKKTGIGKND